MNRLSNTTIFLGASLALCAVPYKFGPGSPARSQEVNDNFATLDSALQAVSAAKASNQDLSTLRSRVSTDSATLAKAITDSTTNLRKSVGGAITQSALAGIRDSLRAKLDTSFRSQVALMTATGIHSQNYWLSEQDVANSLGTPANGTGMSAANGNQVVVGGDNGLHLKTASNDLVVPRTGDPTINGSNLWHAGNLKPDSLPYLRAIGKSNVVNTPFQVGNSMRGEGAAVVRDWRTIEAPANPYEQRVSTLEFNWYNQSWLLSQLRSAGMESGRFSVGLYDYNTKTTAEYFTIQPNGNALFNKNLVVNGAFHATTMAAAIRASDVADYVFEPDYRLAPLSEIEEYTKANKHLPEVPSASEMEATGVDLAKMNMLLLRKVEELTLHAIEQNKRIEAQEMRLERQQAQLESLARHP